MRIIKSFTLNILIGIVAVGLTISSQTQAALFGVNDSAIQAGLGIAAHRSGDLGALINSFGATLNSAPSLGTPTFTREYDSPNFIFARLKDGSNANSTIPSICHWECRDTKRTAKN